MTAQAAAKVAPATKDAERKSKLDTLHTYLANYVATAGTYPSLANLNNRVWVSANLPGIDSETFRDPEGLSLILSGGPQAKSFAYQPVGSNPKVACDGTAGNPCVHYHLTAVLSNNQPLTVQDP
jgi:hypothetical protein